MKEMSAVESIQSDVAWIEARPWNHETKKRVQKPRRTPNVGIIGADVSLCLVGLA